MKALSKLAVAAILAVAITGIFFFMRGTSSVAFADVLQGVRTAQSVSFKGSGTITVPGLPPQQLTTQTLITDSGRMRQTVEPGGVVMIIDWREGKWLTLDAKNKQATVMDVANLPESQKQVNLLDQFKKLDEKAATPLGEKEIAGHKTRGFQVTSPATDMTIWADVQTHLPVLVEQTLKTSFLPTATLTLTDFVWNAPVDESLVSLKVPDGYAVQNMKMDMSPTAEKDLIDALKAAAELNGGTFPKGIDVAGVADAVGQRVARLQRDSVEFKELQTRTSQAMPVIGRGWMFIGDPKNGSDWHYAGASVELGKAGVPVFWYQPASSTTYRVIDADMKVREVRPAELPTVPSVPMGTPTTAPAAANSK